MLGVCYYPEHWEESFWAKDALEMRELGLTYVRLGEFAWSKIEPKSGAYQFAWLDRAIDTLAAQGLKIIMCTPTATPPKWLIDQHPDILPVDIYTGQQRGFGSRRHYDFSSQAYFSAAMKITQVITQHYANHPAIVGWQTDNELACHDTTHSGSDNAKRAFQQWCQSKYTTIEELNRSWGTIFWSMEYQSFSQIELPILAVTEAHPSHQLAYRRFSSDQVIKFHNAMIDVIRTNCPTHFVTHNFIPMVDTQCDNFALADELDFACYDNYPLGRTDLFFSAQEPSKFKRYMRTGHPDFSSCSFDHIRGISHDHFWIMEQQPGPVNWGGHNPRPEAGMVKLWSWEAVSHGASTICYFRWRQVPFAQEQMHAGIKRVDNSKSIAWDEVAQFNQELTETGFDLHAKVQSDIAIVMDAHNQWVTEIERQGDSFNQQVVEFEYYSTLRQLGLNVDFISQDCDVSQYRIIVAPCLPIINDDFLAQCIKHKVHLVAGPRSGSKTDELTFAPNLAPGKLQALLPVKVLSVETLRADCTELLHMNHKPFVTSHWNEEVEISDNADIRVLAQYRNKQPAIVQNDQLTYIATLTELDCLIALFTTICAEHNIVTIPTPVDIRLSMRGDFGVLVNYGDIARDVTLPFDVNYVLGTSTVKKHGVSVFKLK